MATRPSSPRPWPDGCSSPAISATSSWTSTARRRSISRALGGADTALVNDLTGTDVTKVDIDLAAAIGGGAGDGAADAITVNGTNGADDVAVAANGGVVDVTGLFTAVGISHSEVANDSLAINGLGGDDDVAIGVGVAELIQTLVDLGSGVAPPSQGDRGPPGPRSRFYATGTRKKEVSTHDHDPRTHPRSK